MSKQELGKVLADHKKWIIGEDGGKRADLGGANLRGADLGGADFGGANLPGANLHGADLGGANLRGADLHRADLGGADLYEANLSGADLGGADLYEANLSGADLGGANLRGADLYRANLRGADLGGADLRGADLSGADLDMSCWPLWCGSLGVKIDEKLKKQLMYHVIDACGSEMFTDEQVEFANGFHRVGEINEIKRRG